MLHLSLTPIKVQPTPLLNWSERRGGGLLRIALKVVKFGFTSFLRQRIKLHTKDSVGITED